MEFEEVINNRITTLKYETTPIKKTDIDKIINSGIIAPSAKNRQPWRFYITTQEERNKIADLMDSWEKGVKQNEFGIVTTIHRSANIIRTVPEFILIYKYGDNVVYKQTSDILSIGAAIENMILEATNLKIDTTWIADVRFTQNEINQYLEIENMELMSGIALGYRKETNKKKSRFLKNYLILNERK